MLITNTHRALFAGIVLAISGCAVGEEDNAEFDRAFSLGCGLANSSFEFLGGIGDLACGWKYGALASQEYCVRFENCEISTLSDFNVESTVETKIFQLGESYTMNILSLGNGRDALYEEQSATLIKFDDYTACHAKDSKPATMPGGPDGRDINVYGYDCYRGFDEIDLQYAIVGTGALVLVGVIAFPIVLKAATSVAWAGMRLTPIVGGGKYLVDRFGVHIEYAARELAKTGQPLSGTVTQTFLRQYGPLIGRDNLTRLWFQLEHLIRSGKMPPDLVRKAQEAMDWIAHYNNYGH